MKSLLPTLFAFVLLFSCSSTSYTVEEPSSTYIVLGTHGGFTGADIKQYYFKNGQCIELHDNAKSKALEPISKATFKTMLNELERLNFNDLEINDVGNMNSTIRLVTPDTDHTVQFTDQSKNTTELKLFFTKYYQLK